MTIDREIYIDFKNNLKSKTLWKSYSLTFCNGDISILTVFFALLFFYLALVFFPDQTDLSRTISLPKNIWCKTANEHMSEMATSRFTIINRQYFVFHFFVRIFYQISSLFIWIHSFLLKYKLDSYNVVYVTVWHFLLEQWKFCFMAVCMSVIILYQIERSG